MKFFLLFAAAISGLALACADLSGEPITTKNQSAILASRALVVTHPAPYVFEIKGPQGQIDCEGLPACKSRLHRNCCNSSSQSAALPSAGKPEEEVFRASGQGGYRIPAFIQISGGPQLAFAEERDHDLWCGGREIGDSGYVRTVVRMRASSSEPWGPKQIVCDLPGDTCGNPTPVYDSANDRIVILLNSNPGDKTQHSEPGCQRLGAGERRMLASFSSDIAGWNRQGLTFSTPEDISASTQKPNQVWDCAGPGNGIDLGGGHLVFPACGGRNIHFVDSVWSHEPLPSSGTSEGTVLQMNDGLLMRNDRSSGGWIEANRDFRRRSAQQNPDGSWGSWFNEGQPISPAHRNPTCGHHAKQCPTGSAQGCQASARRYSSGSEIDRLIFSAPASSEQRQGLALRLSYDEGLTWTMGRELIPHDDENWTGYSSTDRVGDHIGVLFERYVENPAPPRTHTIHYLETSLSAVVCGRPEPIYIGGNSWLGSYQREIVDSDGSSEYWSPGKVGEVPTDVFVRSDIQSRSIESEASLEVRLGGQAFFGHATVNRSEPGTIHLATGERVELTSIEAAKPWCSRSY